MPILTAKQVAQHWVNNGGSAGRAVVWVAVAYGESSFDTDAVSVDDAVGLWQFIRGSWPIQCGPFSNATNPDVNAFATSILSGQGANFAPWDSSYRDIQASGRYSFLGWPEVGSADYDNIPVVAAMLGRNYHAQIVPDAQPGITGTLPGALSWYGQASKTVIPRIQRRSRGYGSVASRLY
jgi:lysozyme-like protein